MSVKRELAKDMAQLVLSVLALSWSPTAIAAAVVPAASLLHIGRDLWAKAPKDPAEQAIAQMLDALGQHEATEDQILRAQEALAEIPKATSLSREDLTGAATHPNGLNTRVVELLMERLPKLDHDTHQLVRRALGAGVAAMTQDRAFWEPLSFELILRLTQDMAQVRDDTGVTRETVA